MRKLFLALAVVVAFSACEQANATGTNLTGQIITKYSNPSQPGGVSFATSVNQTFGGMQACLDAKQDLESTEPFVTTATNVFSTKYRMTLLSCNDKTVAE